jgi:epoxyqueuosine reductase
MSDVISELAEYAAVRGYDAAVASAGHLEDLRREITGRIESGEVDRAFAGERLAHFDFSPTIDGKRPGSIIITAAPQPEQLALFRYRGRDHAYPIPPTYADDTDVAVAVVLHDVLAPRGFKLSPARIPLKLLAVRTGLAKYGRNNIAYHPRFGSYCRLQAFVSDLPATTDRWIEPTWLPECTACTACVQACPTGAIPADRAVILAERCLTYFNERPEDFPDWLKPAWHTCLVGCLRCQLACPVDRDIDIEPGEPFRFGAAETENLLAAGREDDLTPKVREKLAALGFLEDRGLIVRNLRVLLERDGSS